MSASPVIDMPAVAALLKERFYKASIALYEEQPAWALLDANEDFGGTDGKYPLETNTSQGIAGEFRDAADSQTSPDSYAWLMTTKRLYSVATLDGPTFRKARGDKNSFLDLVSNTTMQTARGHQLECGVMVFGDGTGTIGQIGAIPSAGVLVLSNPSDAQRFYPNMRLQMCSTYGGPAPEVTIGYVVAVNRRDATPYVTVSTTPGGSPATPAGWAVGGYLNRKGNLNKMMSGFGAWIPRVAPTVGDLYYGVPRWRDSKLYGVFYDGSKGRDIASALIQANGMIFNEGGKPNLCVMNNRSLASFKDTIQGTVEYESIETEAGISYESIKFRGDAGKFNVIADRNCPAKTAFMLQTGTWEKLSVGPTTGLLEYPEAKDGFFYVRPDDDAVQARIGGDLNLVCKVPAWNGQIALPV